MQNPMLNLILEKARLRYRSTHLNLKKWIKSFKVQNILEHVGSERLEKRVESITWPL